MDVFAVATVRLFLILEEEYTVYWKEKANVLLSVLY